MESRSDFGSTSCLKRVLEAVLEALLLSLCAPWRRASAQTRARAEGLREYLHIEIERLREGQILPEPKGPSPRRRRFQ